jgi:hypothetical protein
VSPRVDPHEYVPLAEQGRSNREIADHFGVSESTVRRGLQRVGYRRNGRALPPPSGIAAQQAKAARVAPPRPTPAAAEPTADVVATDVIPAPAPPKRRRRLRLPSTARLLAVLVPLFLICVGALAAIVALGYSSLSNDVTPTTTRVPAAALSRLTPAGGITSDAQVTLVMGSGNLGAAVAGDARRILLVRTDPGRDTISLLALPTSIDVALEGKLGESVTVSTAGPPPQFIRTIDRLLGIRVNHLILADAGGFDDLQRTLGGRPGGKLPAAGSGSAPTGLHDSMTAGSGPLHLSAAGSEIHSSFTSDLDASQWVALGRVRMGADQAVLCRLGRSARTTDQGDVRPAGAHNQQALDAFLGRSAAAAGACTTVPLSTSWLANGIGAGEALAIAALVLLGLIVLTLLRPLAVALAGRMPQRAPAPVRPARVRRAPRPKLHMPSLSLPSVRVPRPRLRGRPRSAPAIREPRALPPVARYTTLTPRRPEQAATPEPAASAPEPAAAPPEAIAAGEQPALAPADEPQAEPEPPPQPEPAAERSEGRALPEPAQPPAALPPAPDEPRVARIARAEPAPSASAAAANGAREATRPRTGSRPARDVQRKTAGAARWVRQCAKCGRRELSRQWETREQAGEAGRLASRTRLFRGEWHCERCGGTEFDVVEYKGPRWMQWE